MKKLLYILSVCLYTISYSHAEDIHLVADDKVEWHQNEQKMVATGNAVASKKDMNIRADKMTGYYSKYRVNGQDKTGISTVHAEGNVKMHSSKADGFGDTLDYNVADETMILKGRPAKITTEKETITATESITYYPNRQQAVALGEVIASNDAHQIHSNKMVSYFSKNPQGGLEMERVEIFDNLKIISKDATVTAEKGVYLPKENKVKLFDNVIIEQNGNFLKGDMAETNLSTGISKLLTRKSSGKRVTGVFKEKSQSNKENKQ